MPDQLEHCEELETRTSGVLLSAATPPRMPEAGLARALPLACRPAQHAPQQQRPCMQGWHEASRLVCAARPLQLPAAACGAAHILLLQSQELTVIQPRGVLGPEVVLIGPDLVGL